MIPAPSRVLEILEEAIYQEQSAHDDYLKAAGSIENESEKERYRRFAGEEARHRQRLEERWRALTGRRFRYEPSRQGSDSLSSKARAAAVDALNLETLERVMERELEAAANYREVAGIAPDEESRRLFLELAGDEQRHYEWFRGRQSALEDGGLAETLPGAIGR